MLNHNGGRSMVKRLHCLQVTAQRGLCMLALVVDAADLNSAMDRGQAVDNVERGRKKPLSTRSTASKDSPATITTAVSASASPQILPRSYLASAFRSQTRGYFVDSYLPNHSHNWPKLETDLSVIPTTGWLQSAVASSSTDTLLDDALTALTLVHLERLEKQPARYQSSVLYSKAMRELSKRLQYNDVDCLSDTTLAGVMALTTYETQTRTLTQANGWLSHVRGASSLVRLRGERNFTSTFSQHLFLGSQLNELIHAVGRRKRMPTSADWSGFQSDEESPSAIQLFDILQELPYLIEYADAIKSSIPGTKDEYVVNHLLALTSRAQTFEMRMASWHSRLENSVPLLFWPEPSNLYQQAPQSHPGRVFPTFFCFPNIAVAEQVVLSWTALLFIPRLLRYTEQRLQQSGELPSGYKLGSSLNAIVSDPSDLAKKVAQSLEFFLHPDAGLMEMSFIGFPMNLSMATCYTLGLKEAAVFGLIRARLREMNTGVGDLMEAMLEKGGGLEAARLLVS